MTASAETDPMHAAGDNATGATVDDAEIARFSRLAERWWDPAGEMRALHALNPVRIAYVRDRLGHSADAPGASLRPFEGLRVLDIGCGGGLVAEPMARLGAEVVAVDAAARNIEVARQHAAEQGLDIDYRATTAEALVGTEGPFDAVLALEIVEHVADLPAFVSACAALAQPEGSVFFATINRTLAAYGLAIVAAERVLGWLPAGTHEWSKFVRPSELVRLGRARGLQVKDLTGVAYRPLSESWQTTRNLSVNYMAHAVRASA